MHFICYLEKLSNLMLKTRPKQLLGSPLLDIVLPGPVVLPTLVPLDNMAQVGCIIMEQHAL
jgi:hypothetical protein